MSPTDDPSSDPNPPADPGADDAREDVDDMDDRVFGGAAEKERQQAERSAVADDPEPDAGGADGDAPPAGGDDPMAGEAPSG